MSGLLNGSRFQEVASSGMDFHWPVVACPADTDEDVVVAATCSVHATARTINSIMHSIFRDLARITAFQREKLQGDIPRYTLFSRC